jgi:hypothetical protein
MSATVAQMTKDELQELIGAVVEQKLVELFGDPDEGLPLNKALHDRLVQQMAAVTAGDRGGPLEDVTRNLGLA